jgi:predicted enzyme related to lactoylglutathione lyase
MGNPFVHLDLACDDPAAAKKFYAKIFAWKFKDFPQMKWTGIDVGKGVGGGLGAKQMPDQPSAWTAYVEVDDVKSTIAKAQSAGAAIVVPYMDIPGMGAFGVFIDPQGAALGVWQTAKKPAAAKKAGKKKAAKTPAAPAKKAGKKKAAKKK